MKYEGYGDTWRARSNPQRLGKRTGRPGNKRISGNHLNSRIIKTEENPEYLRRLVDTQTPMESRLLTLVRKTLKGVKL